MADTVKKPSQDNGETGAQAPPLPYESVRIAHWMRTNCPSSSSSSSLRREGKFFVADQLSKEKDKSKQLALVSVPNLEGDTFVNAEELKEIIESTKPAVLEDSLKRDSNKLKNGHLGSFPTFNATHKRESFLSLKGPAMRTVLGEDFESGRNGFPFDRSACISPSNPVMIHAGRGTSSGENYFQPAGLAPHLDLSMKPYNFIERSNLATSTSNWNDAMKSRLDLVPYGCNSTANPILHRVRNIANSNNKSKENVENSNYCSNSHVHDKTTQGFLERRSSRILISGLKGAAADCVPDQHQNTNSVFSHQSCPAEGTETQKLYDGSSAVQHLPSSLHDVETMRIDTTVDSAEGSSGGYPRLSQTTHHLWITKKTNINLSESGQFARESRISSKMGSSSKNLFNVSPDIGLYGQQGQGVKLLSLGGSVNCDNEKVRVVKNSTILKNESSAETNILDIIPFQENHLSGIHSQSSKKQRDDQTSPTFQTALTYGGKGIKGQPLILVPDINQALPEPPASPADDRDSTSRTQTLDMEHLFSNAEQMMDSKSISYPASSLGLEPSSRWIKRLKSASDSAYGTKSLNLEDKSQEKAHNIFNKIVKVSKSILDPKFNRYLGEEQMVPAMSFLNGKPSSSNSMRKSQDIKLSHPWIQRWIHFQSATSQKKIEPVLACDPEKSNAVLDEVLQKRQFPSIAALALMGKALNGFRPCKFMKRGCIMVWNTDGD